MSIRDILTSQEYKLGKCLVQGLSLRRAAVSMGITYETARDKLKIMYQKTGTNSQLQLALLIDRSERQPAAVNKNLDADGPKDSPL
jgi:DNA-binding CsgD family transcriptional regulator